MFKKLKRKLILINMSLLSIVFISIFSIIYIITAISLENDLKRELKLSMNYDQRRPIENNPMMANLILVEVASDNSIANIISYIEFDDEVIKDTIYQIMNSENKFDIIKINGISYGYLKGNTPVGNTKIVLKSREAQMDVLGNLLKVFLIVGAVSLILLLLISIYLTNESIKPIIESFEKQKQFIADASHELKTPLTIIKTNTSVILSNNNESVESQKKWIDYINNQTERMSKLIDEMLSLTKLDIGKELREFTSFDISKVINNSILAFEAVLFENNIDLVSNVEEELIIKGDKENIKKVFIILLDNAIKYTNKNGIININLKRDKNRIILKIKNTGEGIEKENLEKIFERFYRVDSSRSRSTGGYGLGLSIAKSIVKSHKGKIYAESNLGRDTTFIVEFNNK